MSLKKIVLFVAVTFLQISKSNAQFDTLIEGRITDYNTELPLAHAVVKTDGAMATSDSTGYYEIQDKIAGQLKISLLGFEDKTIHIKPKQHTYNIRLKRKYFTLSDVEIKTSKLNVDSIVAKAVENVPVNYLPQKNTLKASLGVLLYNSSDTIIDFNKTVYLEGLRAYSFHYDIFSRAADTPIIKENRLTKELIHDYICEDDEIVQSDFQKALKRYMGLTQKDKIVVSAYTDNNTKYYDLVFIDSTAKVRYSPLLLAFGYGPKMKKMAQKKYINLTEIYINTVSYAVSLYSHLNIETTDAERTSFMKLKDKADIDNWIDKSIEENRKYAFDKFSFEKLNNNFWMLRSVYHFDNLIHPLSRDLNSAMNYTYIQQYNIVSTVAKSPIDASGFDIDRYLDHTVLK